MGWGGDQKACDTLNRLTEVLFRLKRFFYFRLISVEETTASFLGTKVEIKMKKTEPGSWAKLNFPRHVSI
jgi:hypothetical protein